MAHAAAIVGYGPHPPGSEAQRKVGDYIISQLKSYRLEVQTEEFQAVTPIGILNMRNIWGVLPGKSGKIIILASHYDSKYFKDFQFVGANDGGSSSAVLLELARVLAHGNPTEHAIWFVFFDGEEALREWSDFDSLYGSREFVKMLNSQQKLSSIGALILLDLVGEKDLSFRRDTNSTPWLVDVIWSTAARLGDSDRFRPTLTTMIDDHIPFAQQGVPVVDIIDLEYAYWHTAEDTLDKLSAENMQMVAEVVFNALPEVGAKVSGR
jgi:glutaminyl-peptide cyclotransferase